MAGPLAVRSDACCGRSYGQGGPTMRPSPPTIPCPIVTCLTTVCSRACGWSSERFMRTTKDPVGAPSANGTAPVPPVPEIEKLSEELAGRLNGNADARTAGTDDLAELLHALQAMKVGDFSVRMAGDRVGIIGKIADTFNEIVATNQRMAGQLEGGGQEVGRDGRPRQRVRFGLDDGAWGEMESSVNALIDDLLWPTTEVTRAIAAVAQGDLLQAVPLDVDGRPLKGEV